MQFLRDLAHDLATLRRPVTAAAVVATGLAILAPFGVTPDSIDTGKVTGAIAALGLCFAYVERRLGRA